MKFRRTAVEAVSEVRNTASKIGETVQWSTNALVAVSVVSVVALIVAAVALVKVQR